MTKTSQELKIEYAEFLNTLGIQSLRSLGREVGVNNPTKNKTKAGLIELIIAILVGELAPTERTNRGAPVKAEAVNPKILLRLREIGGSTLDEILKRQKDIDALDQEIQKAQENKNVISVRASKPSEPFMDTVFVGQIVQKGSYASLYLLDNSQLELPIIIDFEMMAEYNLKEGDIISCHLKKKEGFCKVTEIFMINEVLVSDHRRQNFDLAEISFEKQSISIPSNKFISWFFPIVMGGCSLIVSPSKAGKSNLLKDVCVGLKANQGVKTFVLLLEQQRENIFQFQELLSKDELVYTTYEQDVEEHVALAELILNRAKSYAETGKDVVLLVDGLLSFAKAYDECTAMDGKMLSSGLTSKTIRYIKKFLSSARNFKQNGSLTLVCTTPIQTGNPDDDLFFAEISALFETIIRLDSDLAKKRVFPAIDFKNSFSSLALEHIKEMENESVISCVVNSGSYEDFISKIK